MMRKKPTRRQAIRKRTQELRRQISAMDYASSGTLLSRLKTCGRESCRCMTNPDARHGPYHEWTRRKDGRLLVHRIVSPEEAALLEHAIGNRREIQRLLALWEEETAAVILGEDRLTY